MTKIQRAARYLLLARMNFANLLRNYGYSKLTKPKSIHRDLESISERLKNTYVENLPYQQIIKKYDHKDAFIFADPPYLNTGIKFAELDLTFGLQEHIELRGYLVNAKGKFLLTINDCEEIRALYRGCNIKPIETTYSVGENGKKVGELIISNYTK